LSSSSASPRSRSRFSSREVPWRSSRSGPLPPKPAQHLVHLRRSEELREGEESSRAERREDRAAAHPTEPLTEEDEEDQEVDPEPGSCGEGDTRVLHGAGQRDAEDPEHGEVERGDEDGCSGVVERVERLREDLHARRREEPEREEADRERRLV